MELRDYWLTIRRRWKLIVLCVLLATAAASLLTWQSTPLYASSSQIFVSTASANASEAGAGNQFATQRVTSYVDLVGTRKLSETVAEKLGGEFTPDAVRGAVTAEVVPDTVNMVITARYDDPVVARDIAQAYAVELSRLVSEIETPQGGGKAPIRASIVDNAQADDTPVSPNVPRNVGLGILLGLLLGVGLAVLRDLLDTSISTSADLAQVTSRPVLGNINTDTVAVRKVPSEALGEPTPWAEAFRVLRTNMQYVEVDSDHRVFVISSSLPSEGRSTTATNLAITLAMAGETVCIVECDLRRPTMATRLSLDDSVGTTSVLIGKVSLDDALQPYGDTGLQVLTSGPRPPNPSELLQSHQMESLIKELRDRFSVVLLDAPPLLPVTDAALLAARADGMLAVVRHGRTTRDQLAHALERVDSVGAKCVGVVMNMVPAKGRGRRGYGYSYGYDYTYTERPPSRFAKRKVRHARAY
ncbi:polysaccharide biosynthesis tyrosine autokinase [Nocardioides plantarum]|uniref:Polysaccharide biosynthesis tyrosine autokinase n=1 Tax=Nocardioides plantarum TaxID=29299 RepID=A0ABV5K945_9ACTN|nr:polysaccharide biosynthesis tyrosine autokinase [Nocardioides plantarum]